MIRPLIRPHLSLGGELELPQCFGNLLPDSVGHPPNHVIPYHWHDRCWGSGKENVWHRPVWHATTRQGNIRSESHRLIKRLLHVQVCPWSSLTYVCKNTLVTLGRCAPPGCMHLASFLPFSPAPFPGFVPLTLKLVVADCYSYPA
jgi:hypothetical protein